MCDFLCDRDSLANGDSLCDLSIREHDPHCEIHCDTSSAVQKSLVNGNSRFWCTQMETGHLKFIAKPLLHVSQIQRRRNDNINKICVLEGVGEGKTYGKLSKTLFFLGNSIGNFANFTVRNFVVIWEAPTNSELVILWFGSSGPVLKDLTQQKLEIGRNMPCAPPKIHLEFPGL